MAIKIFAPAQNKTTKTTKIFILISTKQYLCWMINNEKTFNVRKILITLISSRWFLWRSKKHENTFWNFGTCFSYVLQIVKILFRQFWFVLTIMYYSNFRIAPPNLKLTVDLVRTLDLSEATWDESHHPLVICLSEWVPRFKSAGPSKLKGQGGNM